MYCESILMKGFHRVSTTYVICGEKIRIVIPVIHVLIVIPFILVLMMSDMLIFRSYIECCTPWQGYISCTIRGRFRTVRYEVVTLSNSLSGQGDHAV